MIVYRLGAGLHGLGTPRHRSPSSSAAVLLAVTLAYAELLRRYGTPGLVEWLFDGVRWSRAELGAFPRPIEAVLGIPALVWGCHMRARRRQGWWVCAFGVAATAPVASSAAQHHDHPRPSPRSPCCTPSWSACVLGCSLIRVDVALTGPARPARPPRRGGDRRTARSRKRTSPLF